MAQIVHNNSRREKRQLIRRLGILTDAQAALGWFVILALAALVGTIYVSQASRIATSGRRVQILQNQLEEIKRENAALEREIAEAQALDRVQAQVAEMGFLRAAPEDIEYMVVEAGPVPEVEPVVEAPAPAPAEPVETMGEALLLVLEESLNGLSVGESSQRAQID
ncbi:MAG: hypothetical protein R3272_07555 [Candidatus Promineifilaceae bacterium]|nr:hypothetical protein [Candidatus Promineifilaceae bacterium]